MVEILLTLLIGWKNYPPIFCTSTETVTDLANSALHSNRKTHLHKLDNHTEAVLIDDLRPLQKDLSKIICDPYLKSCNVKPTSYVDVFVDDFWGLSQGPANRRRHVQSTLLHELY